jgi:hypothetical protein
LQSHPQPEPWLARRRRRDDEVVTTTAAPLEPEEPYEEPYVDGVEYDEVRRREDEDEEYDEVRRREDEDEEYDEVRRREDDCS